MSMADLLAQQESKALALHRGMEVEGQIVAIFPQEIILDLGSKSEGVLQKKDLSPEQVANLNVGDKILSTVIYTENDSGQVVLGLQKALTRGPMSGKWRKFEEAEKSKETLTGKGIEVNKGGLIVEINGVRGFLPLSQVSLSAAANLEELIDKDIQVAVIEVDPDQNRLIFSQKTKITPEVQEKLAKLKNGQEVEGVVAAILPFGAFLTLTESGLEGLVHISEIAWEKVEDANTVLKIGDTLKVKVLSADNSTGRVNLSLRQLTADPFTKLAEDFQADDVVKGEVQKVSAAGVSVALKNGVEGIIPLNKMDAEAKYEPGETITCLVDSVDTQKRRVNLVPFVTSTAGLIYK